MHECKQEETLKRHQDTLSKHDDTIYAIKELTAELRQSNNYSKEFMVEIKEHIKAQTKTNEQMERRMTTVEFEMTSIKKRQDSTEFNVKDIIDSNTIRTDKTITGKIKSLLPTGLLLALLLALFGMFYTIQTYMEKAITISKTP
jgi:membrane-associated HD superfamily phosphohydrolase